MSDKKICAITGSNGYVGGCVKNYLAARGWDILELTRQPKPGTRGVAFQLGAEVSPSALAGVAALVHCAYDFKPLRPEDVREDFFRPRARRASERSSPFRPSAPTMAAARSTEKPSWRSKSWRSTTARR